MNIGNFLIDLSDKLIPRSWDGGYSKLTKPEQVFVCIWDFESEVINGGLLQYFFNSSGDNAQDLVDSLKSIGANLIAEIMQNANAIFSDSKPPGDKGVRETLLLELNDEANIMLDKMDNDCIKYLNNISELLYSYVIKNRSDFSDYTIR